MYTQSHTFICNERNWRGKYCKQPLWYQKNIRVKQKENLRLKTWDRESASAGCRQLMSLIFGHRTIYVENYNPDELCLVNQTKLLKKGQKLRKV